MARRARGVADTRLLPEEKREGFTPLRENSLNCMADPLSFHSMLSG
jgi:hypothetical protein